MSIPSGGSVSFVVDPGSINAGASGIDSNGNASMNFSTASLVPGNYTMTPTYGGVSGQDSPSTGAPVPFTVTPAIKGTTTTGTVNPTPVVEGQNILFSANVQEV